MEILRVFNNNVVLSRNAAGQEVILTGRGLGFQGRPGDPIDESKVARTFMPTDGRDPDNFGALIADIPPEHITLADEALDIARRELSTTLPSHVVVALADHLSFAIKRAHSGIGMEYPLRSEVSHLYPRELAAATKIVAYVNSRLDEPIPQDEAVAITLHLVNAGFASGDLSETYRMTGLFRQLFEVVEQAYGRPFDRDSVSAARFITHLRYFFIRMRKGEQLSEGHDILVAAIQEAYPQAYSCALKLAAVLELRLGDAITDNEIVYLAMHVARLSAEPDPATSDTGVDVPTGGPML
ncbi:transcriptional antiterminator, BglG family [Raineyella antarctica]|uniref:Transcriptional antiterminator, BglG family n=1 Tax=Raineyella antarctica TaxID=1577474 RepID=A0A1G6GHC6_9ACTN|nr:PRD domain-containing protein [Raineyella antarctica]SDB81350.1 transcriptional antiterminator, BglG family [Raineyella antarctica]